MMQGLERKEGRMAAKHEGYKTERMSGKKDLVKHNARPDFSTKFGTKVDRGNTSDSMSIDFSTVESHPL
jgi:hypothetical protein